NSAADWLKDTVWGFFNKGGYVLWKREFLRFWNITFFGYGQTELGLDVLFDVGANAGQFAREARETLPSTIIHSFEPHPRTFEKLLQSRSDSRIHAHRLTLSDKSEDATLYEYETDGDGTNIHSLIPDAQFPTLDLGADRPKSSQAPSTNSAEGKAS